MYAHTESELSPFVSLQACIQVFHRRKNAQPSPYCSLRIVFMRLGIAEIDEETVTEQLGDMPIVALDHVGTHPLIGTDDSPVLFGIELRREFGGIDQVTEHDGELAAFGVWCVLCGWWRFVSRWCFLGS